MKKIVHKRFNNPEMIWDPFCQELNALKVI